MMPRSVVPRPVSPRAHRAAPTLPPAGRLDDALPPPRLRLDGVSGDGSREEDGRRLAALVTECGAAGISRRVLLLRLSRLPPPLARPHHLRLAHAALDPLSSVDRARAFALDHGDVAVVWRGEAQSEVEEARASVGRLFADMPGVDPDGLVLLHDLPRDAPLLLARLAEPPASAEPASAPARAKLEPLDPASLAALEATLGPADLASFARRRRICEQVTDGRLVPRWEKRFISVDALAAALVPLHAPQADRWLFRRLTRTLDRRMLALLSAPGELQDAGAFSLNLNVGSILSPEFLKFDASLPNRLRGRVTIDLAPADVLADLGAFVLARDFARARGYRLLLRNVTADLLPVFPLRGLGLDLLQLRWSEDLAGFDEDAVLSDAPRIVLGRAHSPEALDWGRAHGITLFQGRAVDPA